MSMSQLLNKQLLRVAIANDRKTLVNKGKFASRETHRKTLENKGIFACPFWAGGLL